MKAYNRLRLTPADRPDHAEHRHRIRAQLAPPRVSIQPINPAGSRLEALRALLAPPPPPPSLWLRLWRLL